MSRKRSYFRQADEIRNTNRLITPADSAARKTLCHPAGTRPSILISGARILVKLPRGRHEGAHKRRWIARRDADRLDNQVDIAELAVPD